MANDKVIALTATSERHASTMSGYGMLIVLFLAILADIYGINRLPLGGALDVGIVIVATLVFILVIPGFYMLQPNQAAAITLFGEYRGTDRTTGLRWTWPWMSKKKVSVRANNFISDKIKVNDLRGNPIDIAAQIMWRVVDTAQALFDVDDYKQFVRVQVEAAIRAIGSRYPYDDFTHQEVTLRGNHDEVGAELRKELQERLNVAGITIDECGFGNHSAAGARACRRSLRRRRGRLGRAAHRGGRGADPAGRSGTRRAGDLVLGRDPSGRSASPRWARTAPRRRPAPSRS